MMASARGRWAVSQRLKQSDEANSVRSDWLPGRITWARSGFPALVPLEKILSIAITKKNSSLTKLVRSRWLYVGQVSFCAFLDHDFVSVLGQSSAILTSRLVNNAYIIQQSYADGRVTSNYSIVRVLFFRIS